MQTFISVSCWHGHHLRGLMFKPETNMKTNWKLQRQDKLHIKAVSSSQFQYRDICPEKTKNRRKKLGVWWHPGRRRVHDRRGNWSRLQVTSLKAVYYGSNWIRLECQHITYYMILSVDCQHHLTQTGTDPESAQHPDLHLFSCCFHLTNMSKNSCIRC